MEKKIVNTTFYITLIGVITKLIGFVKQTVIANFYGATGQTDAFFLSSGFVSDTSYLICTTLSITFLSMYIDSKNNETEEKRSAFTSSVIMVFEMLAFFVGVLIYVFSPQISSFLAVGYDADQLVSVVKYMHLFSFLIMLQVLITILGTVLNAEKKFLPYQMIGAIQSIVIILSIFCFSGKFGIYALGSAAYNKSIKRQQDKKVVPANSAVIN